AYCFSGLAANPRPQAAGAGSSASQGFAGNASAGRVLFQSAMVAYIEKRYADAAGSLETVVAGEPKATEANFYLGISKLMQGQPRDAVGPLRAVLAGTAGGLSPSGHFYLDKAVLPLCHQ